jgi:dolichol-phosphate mannosyltransferase
VRPLGYKILLELAVRCRPRGVAELPYEFGERFADESKSTVKEGLRFVIVDRVLYRRRQA